jgi:hypothetical protein
VKPDKIMHLSVSYGLALSMALLGWGFRGIAWAVCGVALVAALCLGKEVCDWITYGKAMGWRAFRPLTLGDLLADAAGLAAAVILATFIIWMMEA